MLTQLKEFVFWAEGTLLYSRHCPRKALKIYTRRISLYLTDPAKHDRVVSLYFCTESTQRQLYVFGGKEEEVVKKQVSSVFCPPFHLSECVPQRRGQEVGDLSWLS